MSTQPTKVSLRASFPGLVLCALIGAIAISVVPLIPVFIPHLGKSSTSESGGAQTLVYFVLMACENIFCGPWGIIGAMAGARIGWLIVRAHRVQDHRNTVE